MIICKATQEHYDRLIKDGWKDKYNNIKYDNLFFELAINNDKELCFFPKSNHDKIEYYYDNPCYDIVELINDEWIYIQKYENITLKDKSIICDTTCLQ